MNPTQPQKQFLMKEQDSINKDLLSHPNVRPFYRYDALLNKWIACPNGGTYQEQKPEWTIVHLNVLYDGGPREIIKQSYYRYRYILKKLEQMHPHFICLNQVTTTFAQLLEQTEWVRTSYYISESVQVGLSTRDPDCHGTYILSKVCPYVIHHLKVYHNLRPITIGIFCIGTRKGRPEIVGIISAHLSHLAYRQLVRRRQLHELMEYLKAIQIENKIIIGDINMHSQSENYILKQLELQDIWYRLHSQSDNNYTFNADINNMINQIYLGFGRPKMRLDRILNQSRNINIIQTQICFNQPIFQSTEHVQFMGICQAICNLICNYFGKQIKPKQLYLFPSDHFGLSCKFLLQNHQL